MRKEVIISIFVGLTLGLIITYGFYTARTSTQNAHLTNRNDLEAQTTPGADDSTNSKLKLSTPADCSLTTTSKVQVTGQATPNSFIVTSLLGQIFTTTADEQGKFTQDVSLKPGGNIIIVQATTETGEVVNETRTVVLEDASLTASESAAINPTPKVSSTTTPTPTPKK